MTQERIRLRDYQDRIAGEAADRLSRLGICYLGMECRTGKTLTALSAAERTGARSVLFVSKLKALPSVRNDYAMLQPPYAMTAVNYESVHKVSGEWDLVILDEAHNLGQFPRPNQRARRLREICGGLPVLYLSGTPSPESYSQLYHQLWVCSFSPWRKYANFYRWARDGYVRVRQRMINGQQMNDWSDADAERIGRDIAPFLITWSQEESGFSSGIREHTVTVPMKPVTAELLHRLWHDRVAEIDGMAVLAANPATLLTKMHQISSGTVIAENGASIAFDDSKAICIRDHFRGKTAVFYVYRQEEEMLKRVFPDWTDDPEEFQASDSKVFISQVRRAREGVRLDSADALVFLNLEYSYLSYEQGRNRLVSKERETPADVWFLCSDCGIERSILEAVHGKTDFTLSYYRRHAAR